MFEYYLEQFIKRQGWQIKRTGGKGDYGADLILSSATRKVVIQAKRWKKNVGYKSDPASLYEQGCIWLC